MKILVINCGSSSLKYQLIDMENEQCVALGLVERIATKKSILTQKVDGKKYIIEEPMENHTDAIRVVLGALVDQEHGVIKDLSEIGAVGHRVVHGGEKYANSVMLDDEIMKGLEECTKLAPLHNPANIIGISACKVLMPNTKMVAVFDTAFHQTIPEVAYMYPLPYWLYTDHGVRKYGFHGTSHKYVSDKAAQMMGKDIKKLKLITCHLGNGASICAIQNGKSVETSMGFTPLEGMAMGTRCGSIDPAILIYMMKELKLTVDEVDNLMNKESGLLGVSGVSSDFRDVNSAATNDGNQRAQLAIDIFCYKAKKFIGAYAAVMGGVDAIIFTAGLGENSSKIREGVCAGLEFLGAVLDKSKNNISGIEAEVNTDDSKTKILVIPTNEELVIARDTMALIK
ncbi:acetate kinase [Clostridium estertheticum]|uniref:Acetate kinase n=1 Tax=Clostridium estertheticum TaxID=238834 RepID=A0AA47I799_9CLOT|nr:acetate kinase [Clostridium estertheticum]MBU3153834.1 acetate kinase [Clostridium estertheticum]MBU3198585.1 acetate kinase [Clostridium estertheticum]WAG61388.1 acetate kinase [Clostridium estertheticum]WAG64562.1 acetate kinase [Clostridium estertheticum]